MDDSESSEARNRPENAFWRLTNGRLIATNIPVPQGRKSSPRASLGEPPYPQGIQATYQGPSTAPVAVHKNANLVSQFSDWYIVIYNSAEEVCNTLPPLPIRGGLLRSAHEDMNPVLGWLDDKPFRRPNFTQATGLAQTVARAAEGSQSC